MTRSEEINEHHSCLNKAEDDEPLFILRAKDLTAPTIISFWVEERIKRGLNERNDPRILEAVSQITNMISWIEKKAERGGRRKS